MIIIPLRPVLTNLIVTIVNGIAELLCLSAMLVILALYECRRWTNGASVSIKWHCRQVRAITLFAIIMFIVTECILSVNTELHLHPIHQNYSCVKTEINLRQGNVSDIDKNALAVTYACMRENNTTFSFRTGAYIKKDNGGNFTCFGRPKYEYDAISSVNMSISDAEQYCEDATCVFVSEQVQDNITTIFISDLLIREIEIQNNVTTFFGTKIFFNRTEELSVIAKTAFSLFLNEVSDTFEIRRRIFFGARQDICEYPKKFVKYSKLPKYLFWGTICLWIFLLLAFLVLYLNKKRVFYEIRNVWDWARKTHQLVDSDVRENMHFVWVEVNGEKRMYLTDSRDTDQLLREEDSVELKTNDV